MTWDIEVTEEFEWWYAHLPETEQVQRVNAKVDLLAEQGPALSRPHVAEIDTSRERIGSHVHNLKEMRVGSIRILFAFDPNRTAVLLVAGDKAGEWSAWYREAIPLAIRLWDEHLARLEDK